MRTGHLFAGGGGGLYADLILGHTPIFAVEWDPYACAILRSRAADGWFPGLRVHEGDARLFDPSEYAGAVDCIHAGFPCQDISTAGRGDGINGERSGLYREVLRCADVIRPRYLFLENVSAITSRGLGQVLGDLAERGYDARWTCLAASEVGANHQRMRWWCLADSGSERCDKPESRTLEQPRGTEAIRPGEDISDPASIGRGSRRTESDPGRDAEPLRDSGKVSQPSGVGLAERDRRELGQWPYASTAGGGWWATEPNLDRVVNGMALRSHQIRALGNGQVPLQAATAWKILTHPQ